MSDDSCDTIWLAGLEEDARFFDERLRLLSTPPSPLSPPSPLLLSQRIQVSPPSPLTDHSLRYVKKCYKMKNIRVFDNYLLQNSRT